MRPHRWQPTRLPHLWDSPGKNSGMGCHFLLQRMKVKRESEVAQSCRTLRESMDCSPPGSSVHGIFQTRVLEWGAILFSGPRGREVSNSRLLGHHMRKREFWIPTPSILPAEEHLPVGAESIEDQFNHWTVKTLSPALYFTSTLLKIYFLKLFYHFRLSQKIYKV